MAAVVPCSSRGVVSWRVLLLVWAGLGVLRWVRLCVLLLVRRRVLLLLVLWGRLLGQVVRVVRLVVPRGVPLL